MVDWLHDQRSAHLRGWGEGSGYRVGLRVVVSGLWCSASGLHVIELGRALSERPRHHPTPLAMPRRGRAPPPTHRHTNNTRVHQPPTNVHTDHGVIHFPEELLSGGLGLQVRRRVVVGIPRERRLPVRPYVEVRIDHFAAHSGATVG